MINTTDLMQTYNKNRQERLAKFYEKLQSKMQ